MRSVGYFSRVQSGACSDEPRLARPITLAISHVSRPEVIFRRGLVFGTGASFQLSHIDIVLTTRQSFYDRLRSIVVHAAYSTTGWAKKWGQKIHRKIPGLNL